MKFPYGEIVTSFPKHFSPPETWPEYKAVAMPRWPSTSEEVGVDPKGVRWGIWPLYFEEYITDKEPDLAASNVGSLTYSRFVVWRRIRSTDTSTGWRMFSKRPWRVDGFIELSQEEDHVAKWNKQARRTLRIWERRFLHSHYEIERIEFEEYKASYKKSTVYKKVGLDSPSILERKRTYKEGREIELWGVRNIHTKEVIAGIALCYSLPEKRSVYEAPFILPEAKHVYAATALIDLWLSESKKKGITLAVFSSFWQPGEENSWKNFSAFKSQFNPKYVAYPPTLWKFVRGKIF